jgi:hypothetical protein
MSKSELEEALLFHLKAARVPLPEREYRFAPPRRWRLDFFWPNADPPLAVEIQGGIWGGGRHVRGQGYINDCDKANACALQNIRLLRFTAEHIHRGDALTLIERALGRRKPHAKTEGS